MDLQKQVYFFIHCESNGISSTISLLSLYLITPLGVYQNRFRNDDIHGCAVIKNQLPYHHSHQKKHFFVSAFFNEEHLRCIKNEAGHCPMKRVFGSRNIKCASFHTSVVSASFNHCQNAPLLGLCFFSFLLNCADFRAIIEKNTVRCIKYECSCLLFYVSVLCGYEPSGHPL